MNPTANPDSVSDSVSDTFDASGTDENISDMRVDMEAAFSKFDTVSDTISDIPDTVSDIPDTISDTSETVQNEQPRGPEQKEEKAVSDIPDTISDIPDAVSDIPDTISDTSETKPKTSEIRPPVGWKDEAAKAWGDVPQAAKDHIIAREREVNVALQNTSTARKVAKDFGDIMMQYRAPLQQMGYQSPLEAVNGIMGTAMKLRSGNSQERAQAAAEVIRDFGIDINELDTALAGQPVSGRPTVNGDLESLLDQRLAPVNQFMTQLEAMQHQQSENAKIATAQEVEQFVSANEFASEVRMEMADILDLAAQRGQPMTLQEAYDRACMFHPTVTEKVRARQDQTRAQAAQQNRQSKQHAASSIHGTPGGSPGKKNPETIADAISAAWDMHAQGG